MLGLRKNKVYPGLAKLVGKKVMINFLWESLFILLAFISGVVAARILAPNGFGVWRFLFAIQNALLMVLAAPIEISYAKEYASLRKKGSFRKLFLASVAASVVVGLIASGMFVLWSSVVKVDFVLSKCLKVWAFWFPFAILFSVLMGVLQGAQLFGKRGVLRGFQKLLVIIGFLLMSLLSTTDVKISEAWMMLGVVYAATTILTFILVVPLTGNSKPSTTKFRGKDDFRELFDLLTTGGWFLIATIFSQAMFITPNVVIRIGVPVQDGAYVEIALFAIAVSSLQLVTVLGRSASAVILPASAGGNLNWKQLKFLNVRLIGISLLGSAVVILFADKFIDLIWGREYASGAFGLKVLVLVAPLLSLHGIVSTFAFGKNFFQVKLLSEGVGLAACILLSILLYPIYDGKVASCVIAVSITVMVITDFSLVRRFRLNS